MKTGHFAVTLASVIFLSAYNADMDGKPGEGKPGEIIPESTVGGRQIVAVDVDGAPSEEFAKTIVQPLGSRNLDSPTAPTVVQSPRGRTPNDADTARVTLPPGSLSRAIAARPDGKLADAAPRSDVDFEERYLRGPLIGRGGMGEVRQHDDTVIGRQVAVKVLHPGVGESAESRARFVREARVQGQLQHPSVVPVYDLGVDEHGNTFFTMKRISGRTLAQVIASIVAAPSDRDQHRRKLLGAFADVCLAVEYAHSRGVVHRDLKPANIMLGDFGEVYVLDWGLARLADSPNDAPDARASESAQDSPSKIENGETSDGYEARLPVSGAVAVTSSRSVLGTIGYMAPEQIRGDSVDGRADVYALGAILFELLAFEPLHPGAQASMMMQATLDGISKMVSTRAREFDFEPELENVCIRATATESHKRPSARELHNAVEKFLAGDRDLVRRQEMAAKFAAEAADLASESRDKSDEHKRNQAMRLAGRALALDPQQPDAPKTLMALLLEPPTTMPEEVVSELAKARSIHAKAHVRLAIGGYLSWLIAVPLFLWMGIADWTLAGAMIAGVLLCSGAAAAAYKHGVITDGVIVGGILANGLTLFLLTRLFGPLILVPTLGMSTTLAFALYGSRRSSILAPIVSGAAIGSAMICEATGLLASSYSFSQGGFLVHSTVLDLPRTPTLVTLTLLLCAAVGVAALVVSKVRNHLDQAEETAHVLLWKYRQLVPS